MRVRSTSRDMGLMQGKVMDHRLWSWLFCATCARHRDEGKCCKRSEWVYGGVCPGQWEGSSCRFIWAWMEDWYTCACRQTVGERCGWYHSHRAWMLAVRIDVNTHSQINNSRSVRGSRRKPASPFFLLLLMFTIFYFVQIDPNRTISAGKVDIGAFRTYPPSYTPPSAAASEYQSIPLSKIEDFGVHCESVLSTRRWGVHEWAGQRMLGLLWNKYWVNTLSQSPLISVSGKLCICYGMAAECYDEHRIGNTLSRNSRFAPETGQAQTSVTSTRAPQPTLPKDKDDNWGWA